LLEEDAGPLSAEQAQILQRMQHNVRRLSRLSESMFQLSIPRDVEQSPKLERANIRDSIDEALGDVTLFLEDKRILVSVDVESSEDLLFEPSQIQQAICNLLDNACKFTPRDGTIDIRGYPFFWERRSAEVAIIERSIDRRSRQTKAPNSFRVDIRDSGPGIPEAVVETIFEEFSSYSGGQDRSGWGLGLAISRMILHRHRGRIWAESHPDGAVFSFVLPFQPDASNPAGWAGESEGAHFAKSVEN
jgi:signal transduction histidine kinase